MQANPKGSGEPPFDPLVEAEPVDVTPPLPSGIRCWHVQHVTSFDYAQPVERSHNLVRMRPIQDSVQRVRWHRVRTSPEVAYREFEEVFGNRAGRFEINEPHQSLTIQAETVVEVAVNDPFLVFPTDYRRRIPLAWMPWERRFLEPFLEPPELPEVQLRELYAFAETFARGNELDLTETLFAMNLGIFNEFEYSPGATHIDSTPYEVYRARRGVCQDFANLFICLARLLDIPARYVCGYVHTHGDSKARTAPAATHAWAEIYLPEIGWKGFDPTNGNLPVAEHIRVATGRHYRDVAPTSGWLTPAVQQSMTVAVSVREQQRASPPEAPARPDSLSHPTRPSQGTPHDQTSHSAR